MWKPQGSDELKLLICPSDAAFIDTNEWKALSFTELVPLAIAYALWSGNPCETDTVVSAAMAHTAPDTAIAIIGSFLIVAFSLFT
jgi:hypothetical protein